MASTTTTFSPILTPEQVGDLVIRPLIQQSVAGQVLTTVQTGSHDYRIPVVNTDPSASWTAEGAEIDCHRRRRRRSPRHPVQTRRTHGDHQRIGERLQSGRRRRRRARHRARPDPQDRRSPIHGDDYRTGPAVSPACPVCPTCPLAPPRIRTATRSPMPSSSRPGSTPSSPRGSPTRPPRRHPGQTQRTDRLQQTACCNPIRRCPAAARSWAYRC